MPHTATISHLAQLFNDMVSNESCGDFWKNIPLAQEAFDIMVNKLPATVPDEYDTPQERAGLLLDMLGVCDELSTPRFCLEVRRFINTIAPLHENDEEIQKLEDYINLDIDTSEWCSRYGKRLKIDTIERTERWEEAIYDVEKECDKLLEQEPRGMGFCFAYWSVKRNVLAQHGVVWRSPAEMNPGVMFD